MNAKSFGRLLCRASGYAFAGLTYLGAAVCSQDFAAADVSWLRTANDCLSMGRGLAAFLSTIPDIDRIDEAKQGELMQVLDAACGEQFITCQFEVCRVFDYHPGVALGESPDDALNSKFPDGDSTERSSGQDESLEWLNQYLTCNQLISEIKNRYGGQKKQTLSKQAQAEKTYVLELACSERFVHCGFKSCNPNREQRTVHVETIKPEPVQEPPAEAVPDQPIAASAIPTKSADPVSSESLEREAAELYQQIYKRIKLENKEQITSAVAAEEKRAAQWNRLGNADELRLLEQRRTAHRDRARKDDSEQSESGISNQYEFPDPSKPPSKGYGDYSRPSEKLRKKKYSPSRRKSGRTNSPPVVPF